MIQSYKKKTNFDWINVAEKLVYRMQYHIFSIVIVIFA